MIPLRAPPAYSKLWRRVPKLAVTTRPPRKTQLRRTSREAARRFERETVDRERRLFLTAKFDRAWSALTRLRAKVGTARFRDLMVDLPDALDEIRTPDLGAVAEFHELLSGDDFRTFLAEVTEALESEGGPGALWAKWIDLISERTLSLAKAQLDSIRPA